jgi:hypothetical protein
LVQECPAEPVDSGRGVGAEFQATPITDSKIVKSVVEKFRQKYDSKHVKKY